MFKEFMEFDTSKSESRVSCLEALFLEHRRGFGPNRIGQLLQIQLIEDILSAS